MSMIRRLVVLTAAAEAARRYARANPEQASKLLDQAAGFIDKQTSGMYHDQISGVARKVKEVAGIPSTAGYGPAGNGQSYAYSHAGA